MAGEYGAPPGTAVEPLPGLWEWDNPQNRFHVIRLHYSADEDKRDPAWAAAERGKLPRRAWETEFEISFASGAGKPVFPEFDASRMVRTFPILPIETCRVGVGWDFGHECPACGFYQVDRWGRLRQWGELLLTEGGPLEALIEARNGYLFEFCGRVPQTFDAGDPAGESMTDLGEVRKVLAAHGIQLHTSYSTREKGSYTELRSRFMRTVLTDEGPSPAFIIHPRCSQTIAALQGNFYLKEKSLRPCDEHPWKDLVDQLRYFNANLHGVRSNFTQRMKAIAQIDAIHMRA